MKKILFIFILILVSFIKAPAQSRLEVTIKNIRDVKGAVRVGLFTNKERFLKEATEGKVVPVEATTCIIIFEDLKPGDYAISVIHDENDNGKLDSNILGIPKEGFAFGNNEMGTFGPPSFENAKVKLGKDTVRQTLVLKYF